MIAETLIPLLEERFPDRSLILGPGPHPVATFPAAHPEFGDLVIHDDGDELTIYCGKFTHVHFNNYEEGLTETERSRRIVDDALEFLEEVFADSMEFYGSHFGGGGCRQRSAKPRGKLSKLFFGARTYVWSGPVESMTGERRR